MLASAIACLVGFSTPQVGAFATSIAYDTSIIATEPDSNFGGGQSLSGGPDRVILIRFPEVGRGAGSAFKYDSGTLRLRRAVGPAPELEAVGIINVPWGEGPLRTYSVSARPATEKAGRPLPPLSAATWRERLGQRSGWQKSGLFGSSDVTEIPGVTLAADETTVTINGLQAALQRWHEQPNQNFGIALKFKNRVEFESAQSPKGGPELFGSFAYVGAAAQSDVAIQSVEPEGNELVVQLKNQNDIPGDFELLVETDERPNGSTFGKQRIEGSGSATIRIPKPTFGKLLADSPKAVRLRAVGPDHNPSNNDWTYYEGGVNVRPANPADAAALRVAIWEANEITMPSSRFSWVPEGSPIRFNLSQAPSAKEVSETSVMALARAAGALAKPASTFESGASELSGAKRGSIDAFAGLSGYGDTRYDGVIPTSLALNYDPVPDDRFDNTPLIPHRLLSATDVLLMESARRGVPPALPKSVLVSLVDLLRRDVTSGTYQVLEAGSSKVLAEGSLTRNTILLPAPPSEDPNYARIIRVTRAGQSDDFWVKNWMLLDNAARGNANLCYLRAWLNLPDLPIATANLADGRAISDSANLPPATLQPLVTSNNAKLVNLPAESYWIEIDLGRDRTIAEIGIVSKGKFWNRFRVIGYGTGQRRDEGSPIAAESDFGFAYRQRRDATGTVTYRGPAPKIRFIRIIRASGPEVAELSGIVVRAAELPSAN